MRRLFLTAAIVSAGCGFIETRTPCDYHFPAGFTGWATIEYGVPSAAPLPLHDGRWQIHFDASGLLRTSSPYESGSAHDRYFYDSPAGSQELRVKPPGEGGLVWPADIYVGSPPSRSKMRHFIGTWDQYRAARSSPRAAAPSR